MASIKGLGSSEIDGAIRAGYFPASKEAFAEALSQLV
jgi:hypothetical protein